LTTDSIIIILYFFGGVSISEFLYFFNKTSNIDLSLLFHYQFPTLCNRRYILAPSKYFFQNAGSTNGAVQWTIFAPIGATRPYPSDGAVENFFETHQFGPEVKDKKSKA